MSSKPLREFSAGGVVFKRKNNKTLWLVAKSSPSTSYPESYWRLPKGWLDDEVGGKNPGPLAKGAKIASTEEIQRAALREVTEEGGISARVIQKLGTEKIFFTKENQKVLKFVTFFLMEWISDTQEGPGFETSEISWLAFEEAREKLKYQGEKKMLGKAKELLDSGTQENLV